MTILQQRTYTYVYYNTDQIHEYTTVKNIHINVYTIIKTIDMSILP